MSTDFPGRLKDWRACRGFSQLSLALETGVSTRHLSFLETGRSSPSREMVLRLAAALDLQLRERNGLLLSAGFAPLFGERALDDEGMEQARRAVRLMLDAHRPYPAFALDRYWNIVLWNEPLARMFEDLTRDGRTIDQINALDLVFEPDLRRDQFVNWEEVALAVLKRFRRQVSRAASDEELQKRWKRVVEAPGVAELLHRVRPEDAPPVLVPMKVREGDQIFTWINTLAVFGATGDVTLDELVVESFFPGDELTRQAVEQIF